MEHFLAIYDARNLHAAARRKGVSQPALTKSLRLLEQQLGAELFKRVPTGLEPTGAAVALYPHALAIEQGARFGEMDARNADFPLEGEIRLGVGVVLAVSAFPEVVLRFHHQFPGIEILVESGISNQLVEKLLHERLDAIVTSIPLASLPDDVRVMPLFSTDMVAICREGHPLFDRSNVDLDQLSEFGRVGFVDDTDFEEQAEMRVKDAAARLRPVVRTTSISIIFGTLAATDYFAIVSEIILPQARRTGLCAIPLTTPLWRIELALMCGERLATSRPISAIVEALQDKDAASRTPAHPVSEGMASGP